MNYRDEIRLLVFGKQPHEELTPEEAFSLQALDAGESRTNDTIDLDDPETRETLFSLWELNDKKDENWRQFKKHKLNPLIALETQKISGLKTLLGMIKRWWGR